MPICAQTLKTREFPPVSHNQRDPVFEIKYPMEYEPISLDVNVNLKLLTGLLSGFLHMY